MAGGGSKLSQTSETVHLTSEKLGDMFEGDFANTCGNKFPLLSMGGQARCEASADLRVMTPIGVSRNYSMKRKT